MVPGLSFQRFSRMSPSGACRTLQPLRIESRSSGMTLLSSVWHLVLWDLRNDSHFSLKFPHLLNGQSQCIYFMRFGKNGRVGREKANALYLHVVHHVGSVCWQFWPQSKKEFYEAVSGQSPQDAALIYDPPQRSNLASGEVWKLVPACHNRKQKAYHQHDLDTCHFFYQKTPEL